MAAAPSPRDLAKQLLAILKKDEGRLDRIDSYVHGEHDDPYMPDNATDEYKLLAKRAVSNWVPLLVSTPAQALYVDGFRRGSGEQDADLAASPEWKHWQRSRLDARQSAIYRGALTYGHSFTVTELDAKNNVVTKGLSPLRTAALYEDPANDNTPYVALTVTKWNKDDQDGKARMWDATAEYAVTFKSLEDDSEIGVTEVKRHGASECPVTRFAAAVDLEGRTVGVVEPMIPLQNRINQTVFDLLVAQTYGSFKVRWVTGMAPPMLTEPVYEVEGDPNSEIVGEQIVLDSKTGKPTPAPINHNASRFLFAADPDVHFGSLDETPLGGFIDSIDMSIRHLSAVSQTPPHYLLGQLVNISGDALQSAEVALQRKITEFRVGFGESWERVFRLAGELGEDGTAADDFAGEVIWRDVESRSLAQAADALGKLKEQLGIPAQGLWPRVPGATQGEINRWTELLERGDSVGALAEALRRATPPAPELDDTSGAL